ncbi:MAG TPA: tetratricopeptide repeat protein, partial [Saprospiraceae bacterium]|nr:tetratricopeptide repeat protein [Saprospiraceae bacterium]
IARQFSGDIVGALEDMNCAIEQERHTASYYYVRGNIYILLENYFAALADYDAAIQLDAAFAEAYFNRGIAYLMLNNRASACYDMENAIRLGYKDGEEKLMYLCNF